jgi:transposase-like protein
MTDQEPKTARVRISAETAADIRKAVADGARQADVARTHGISPAAVCRIVNMSRHAPKDQQ